MTTMKKQYKTTKKATSYKIRLSKTYGSVSGNVYALLVNGIEVAWGSKAAIEAKRSQLVKGK
jgi:aspartyl-tRNA synthetase